MGGRRALIFIAFGFLIEIASCRYSEEKREYRLPDSIKPNHYNLEITTHLEDAADFRFSGKVGIELIATKDVNHIILHAKNIDIDKGSISLKSLNSSDILAIQSVDQDEEFDFLILGLKDALHKDNRYVLDISFKGVLQPGLVGYYISSYNDGDGKKEWLAVTQFEANNARRAFPCFDEPAMKATFNISLIRKKDFTAISNMPLIETKEVDGINGWELDVFEKTVPMSTYLVAFVVSKFQYNESIKTRPNETTFRIWARKEALNQTQYAASVGPKVLSFYEDYFGVKFPLPKQDMIALPDFNAGAMENWGLITYRETALLFKEGVSSNSDKHNVANIIAHELAHQWFGNLVTLKWWTDLWLNEGFATYVATLGVNHLQPEWNIINEDSANVYASVFKVDALDSSHPISIPIGHPREIEQIFDDISYKKGSALLRMMNAFLTEDVFRAGLNKYLNEYKYNNAEKDDLLQKLTEVAHERNSISKDLSVKTIMDTWTTQIGYPLITINRDYETGKPHATQKRFVSTGDSAGDSTKQTWWIPLTYMKKGDNVTAESAKIHWVAKTAEIDIEDKFDSNDWLLANVGMTGLYRVNYDKKNWELLTKALNTEGHDGILEMNRFQLLLDSMDLASTNQLSYDIALKLMQYLKKEKGFIAWRGALSGLSQIDAAIKRSEDYPVFKKYVRSLLEPVYNDLNALENLNNKPLDLTNHAVLIHRWSCTVNVPGCKGKAANQFGELMAYQFKTNPIPVDFRYNTYCIGIEKHGRAEWEFMLIQYQKSNVASEKHIILRSLGCSNDVDILKRYLELMFDSNSGIRKQDATTIFSAVSASENGYQVAKTFLFERLGDLKQLESSTPKQLGTYVAVIINRISTEIEFKELEDWIAKNQDSLKDGRIGINQAIEKAGIRLQWIKNNQKHVVELLKELTNN